MNFLRTLSKLPVQPDPAQDSPFYPFPPVGELMAFNAFCCSLSLRERVGASGCGSGRACARQDSVKKAGLSPDSGLQDRAPCFGFRGSVPDFRTLTLTLTLSRQREREVRADAFKLALMPSAGHGADSRTSDPNQKDTP